MTSKDDGKDGDTLDGVEVLGMVDRRDWNGTPRCAKYASQIGPRKMVVSSSPFHLAEGLCRD